MNLADVIHLAKISCLRLSDSELHMFAAQLADVEASVSAVSNAQVGGVPPTSHPHSIVNVFRDDVPVQSLSTADALSGAPESEGVYFKMPPTKEGI